MSVLLAARSSFRRHGFGRFMSSNTTTIAAEFSRALSHRQPAFSVPAKDIRILAEPKDFYALLLDMIKRAQKRIFLSSLYIGSGEQELISTLARALERNSSLQLDIVLDLNRSTRPGHASTASLLLPLIQAYPDRVHVHLFRSPHLRGLLAKVVPPRFNEGWGTWHSKIYGADDDVVISGANLNWNYFTNRRDRYLSFTNHSRLANYCHDFLGVVSTFSYQLLPENAQASLGPYSYQRDGYLMDWPDHDTHPHHINTKVEGALRAFQRIHKKSGSFTEAADSVQLFPMIQGGQFNIREEEYAVNLLFKHLEKDTTRPLLDMTSGYFNLYKPYQKLVMEASNMDRRIVCASPKANGFYGSKGVSGRIPEGYTILERRFMDKVERVTTGLRLDEWEKEGWTYHAKGLWLSPDFDEPLLTLFGSTNLNARSAHIDTELSFMMVVPSSEGDESQNMVLRRRLGEEIRSIREHTQPWMGRERKIRPLTPYMLWLVEDML